MKLLARLLRRRRELSVRVLDRPKELPVNVWSWPQGTWFQTQREKQLPNRPLVTGKGVASEVDLGDSDKANRRNPKCPSEKAAIYKNGGVYPVKTPPLTRAREERRAGK